MSLRAVLWRSNLLYPVDCFAQIARNDSTHFAWPMPVRAAFFKGDRELLLAVMEESGVEFPKKFLRWSERLGMGILLLFMERFA